MPEPGPMNRWKELPEAARRTLSRGSVGRDHLVGLAAGLLPLAAQADAHGRAGLATLVQELLCAAWAASPLDGDLAALLAGQPVPQWPRLPEHLADTLRALANFWKPPADADPWWGPAGMQERRAALLARLGAEPRNLFWKAQAWSRAWLHADWELSDTALEPGSWPRTLAPVRLLALARERLARGDAAAALAALESLGSFVPGGNPGLHAECLLRLGREAEAVDVLARAVAQGPWRTSELLRLSDLATGAADEVASVPGGVAILLYTWNKAGELDETLASLAASGFKGHQERGDARIWVLDNGSTDATPQVLAAWARRMGDALTTLRLPVNVGAPAARNWLLSLPEVRGREFLAFLDDDVSLPADWLGRLGAAVRRFPGASVWGCRVVDEANVLVAQSVDYAPHAPRSQRDASRLLALPTLHLGQPDLGEFAYLRPCVSVTGCCHLLREADIDATGAFDIRFSPSQYDDLERDLRLFLGGGHAVYQGHLCVRHKRRSGAVAEQKPAEAGGALANLLKLECKHGEEVLAGISAGGEALLGRDLERRFELLADLRPGG